MSKHTLRDRIRYKAIRKGLGVVNIQAKMKDNHLRLFGHVRRRGICESVWKIEGWNLKDLKSGLKRPKMT